MILSIFLQNYSQQFIIGIGKIKLYSLVGFVLCITTFVFSLMLIPKYGVKGYVWAIIFSHLAAALFCVLSSKAYTYYYIFTFDKRKIRDVLSYSLPLIPNAVMWWLVNALNRPIMEANLSYSEIGIYAVANKFPSIISMLYGVLSVSLTVSILEEVNKPSYSTFYSKVFRYLFALLVLGAIVMMYSSKILIQIFAAAEFIEAWKYMVILLIGTVLSCMSSYFGLPFTAAKQTKYYLYSTIWGSVASILFNLLLIPVYGLYGACLSFTLSFLIVVLSRVIYIKKFIRSSIIPITIFFVIVLSIAAGCFIFYEIFYIRTIILLLSIFFILVFEYKNLNVFFIKFKNIIISRHDK